MNSQFRRRHNFQWDRRFSVRQRGIYNAEDLKVLENPVTSEELIEKLCEEQDSILNPPCFNYVALKGFLRQADLQLLAVARPDLALLDDRREDSGGNGSMRNWESDKYAWQSEPGENVLRATFDEGRLFTKLKENRTTEDKLKTTNHAERRLLLICDITPLCALVLAATTATRFRHFMKAYLQRYLTSQVLYRVLINDAAFIMEFHIPYMALRSQMHADPRDFRKPCEMLKTLKMETTDLPNDSFYYHAQTSFLLTGVDEWHWTAYCCVDTFFGSEKTPEWYLKFGYDGITGGLQLESYPKWNPREYFLYVLARRMNQATKEWTNFVLKLESRLDEYEQDHKDELQNGQFSKDEDFKKTARYTSALSILRESRDLLLKTLEVWDEFATGDLKYFDTNSDILDRLWFRYYESIFDNISDLVNMRRNLLQRIETFDRIKDGLVQASSLRESQSATQQGKNIGLLTYVTVAYLPLALSSAIFSMAMVGPDTRWIWWAFTSIGLGSITLNVALIFIFRTRLRCEYSKLEYLARAGLKKVLQQVRWVVGSIFGANPSRSRLDENLQTSMSNGQ